MQKIINFRSARFKLTLFITALLCNQNHLWNLKDPNIESMHLRILKVTATLFSNRHAIFASILGSTVLKQGILS